MPSRPATLVLLAAAVLALALGVTGCALLDDARTAPKPPPRPTGAVRVPAVEAEPGERPSRISAVRDVHGIHRGLTPPTAAEQSRVDALIAGVRLGQRGGKGSYDRDRFGPDWTDTAPITWGGNRCRTREDILRRDLGGVTIRPETGGCVVLEGILQDPYTDRTIEFSKQRPLEVQIDHVIPLAYAWQLGARDWPAVKREQFANDPLNLLAVDGPSNQQKNASGPASWLPRNRAIRCAYAVRIARVAQRYKLPMTRADRVDMQRRCRAIAG